MLKTDIHIESIYSEMPFADRFAKAKADGFDAVEIWGWDDKNLPQVKRLLDENDLTLAAMSGDGPLSMCDPVNKVAYIDYIKQALRPPPSWTARLWSSTRTRWRISHNSPNQ